MGENVKSDRESSSQEHTKSTNKIIHLESNIESKNLKNKDEMRFDSNGDEIVYEVRHNVYILDTIFQAFLLLFSIILLCIVFNPSGDMIINSLIFLFGLWGVMHYSNILFYRHKNRFYVTNSGIGFERRHWFRIQKRFFKFGEVGLAIFYFGVTYQNAEIFIIYPLESKPPKRFNLLPKKYQKITIQTTIYKDKMYNLITFIRKRTKEALEAKGIHITDSELKNKIKNLTYKDI
ncbi:TPA: hypothetical protein SBV85_001206 [Campylobacter coli]|nr:hypothetical protein [Campylobacter coli]